MVLNRSKSMYMPCIEIWMLIWQVNLLMKFLQDLFSFFFSTLGWNLFFLFLFFELELWSNCCWIVTSTWIGIQVLVLLIEPIQWAWPKSLLIIANRTKFSLLLCQRKVFFFFSIIHLLYWISSLLLHGDLFFWVQLYKIGSYMICCWVKKKRIYYSIRLCSFLYQYIWTLTSLVFCGNMKNTFLHSQAKEFSNLSGWCLAGWMIVVFLQLI